MVAYRFPLETVRTEKLRSSLFDRVAVLWKRAGDLNLGRISRKGGTLVKKTSGMGGLKLSRSVHSVAGNGFEPS